MLDLVSLPFPKQHRREGKRDILWQDRPYQMGIFFYGLVLRIRLPRSHAPRLDPGWGRGVSRETRAICPFGLFVMESFCLGGRTTEVVRGDIEFGCHGDGLYRLDRMKNG